MIRMSKIVVSVAGGFALLLGIGVNSMRVNAFNQEASKGYIIKKDMPSADESVKSLVSKDILTKTVADKEDKTSIKVKDSTILLGAKWKPEDNFVSATDGDGNVAHIKDIIITGNVNTERTGIYKVIYMLLSNDKKRKITETATIEVKDGTSIKVKDSMIYVGEKWEAADNFISATDKNGKSVPLKDVTVEGNVYTPVPNLYKVTYTVLNNDKKKVSASALIKVVYDKTHIIVKNSTIYAGDKWEKFDNLVSATDNDGKPINHKDIEVIEFVKTQVPGRYWIYYTVYRKDGKSITESCYVDVLPAKGSDHTSLKVKDSTIYVGDKWQAKDNLVSAFDKDGRVIDIKDIRVSGSVNTEKPGDYKVIYTILNGNKEEVSKEATITVKVDQTDIKIKDSTIHVGDKWQPADNFVSATDKDGRVIDFKDITVIGSVNTEKPGHYKITYEIVDITGIALKSATATIMVKA